MTDGLAGAIEIVETYLELSTVPDPEGAARHVAPGFRRVFTGGRVFPSPAECAAFNAKRYACVPITAPRGPQLRPHLVHGRPAGLDAHAGRSAPVAAHLDTVWITCAGELSRFCNGHITDA